MKFVRFGLAAAVALGVPGCTQVLGLDETHALDGVTFRAMRATVGASVTVEPLELAAEQLSFELADAASPGGFRTAPTRRLPDGTWYAALSADDVAVRYRQSADDPVQRHLILPARESVQLHLTVGRERPEAPPAEAQLILMPTFSPAYTTGDQLVWYAVGAWAQRVLAPAESPPNGTPTWTSAALPYSSAQSLVGHAVPSRVTADDVPLLLRYNAMGQLVGVLQAAPFAMSTGPNPIVGTLAAIALDRSVSFNVDAGVAARLGAVPAFLNPTQSWILTAAPGATYGVNTGPTLNVGTVAPATGLVTVSTTYGNPFLGWPSVLTYAAQATRTYAPAGQPAVTLTARLAQQVDPGDGAVLQVPACLPTTVTIQGSVLTTDGQVVSIDRAGAVTISFASDRTGSELYSLDLFDVTDAAIGPAQRRFQSSARQPRWTVPGAIFQGGRRYSLRASCMVGGLPGLAEGDLARRVAGTSTGLVDSPVFSVVTP